MNEFETLDKININEECIVIDILFDNKFSQRMNDIGIIENSKIKVLFKSIFNDTTVYLIKDSIIAIRNNDAKKILVRRLNNEKK